MTHTPGPWIVGAEQDNRAAIVSNCEYYHVAHVLRGGAIKKHRRTRQQTLANARLIAAAPDLLTACKAYEAYWAPTGKWSGDPALLEIRRQMQAAIAKAEGKS